MCRPPLHIKKESASMSDEESDSTLELDGAFLMDQRVFSCFDASCPPLACAKNKLSGLLRHVRECHAPSEVPSWFIRKWELKACSLCQFYFKDLLRYSKCSGRPPSHSAHAHNPPDEASVGHVAVGGQGSASERVSASEQTDASVEEVPCLETTLRRAKACPPTPRLLPTQKGWHGLWYRAWTGTKFYNIAQRLLSV